MAPQNVPNKVFADTSFWIALIDKREDKHSQALEKAKIFETHKVQITTSEMVLAEFLTTFSRYGAFQRKRAVKQVEKIKNGHLVTTIVMSSERFQKALETYNRYEDKAWSLTDCDSINIMNENTIEHALTADSDFAQAGKINLLD
jgi:predicted nucleic acid-binding protein